MHGHGTPPGSDHPVCALSLALVPLSRLSTSSLQPKTPIPTPPPGCPPPSKPTPTEPKALIARHCRISLQQSQPQPPPAGIWTGTIEFIDWRGNSTQQVMPSPKKGLLSVQFNGTTTYETLYLFEQQYKFPEHQLHLLGKYYQGFLITYLKDQ